MEIIEAILYALIGSSFALGMLVGAILGSLISYWLFGAPFTASTVAVTLLFGLVSLFYFNWPKRD